MTQVGRFVQRNTELLNAETQSHPLPIVKKRRTCKDPEVLKSEVRW